MRNIKTIIADDHTLFISGLQSLLNEAPEVEIIDVANSGRELLDLLQKKKADIVLLDINMPLCDGFQWLKSIRELGYHDLPIVMYTNSLSPAHIAKAILVDFIPSVVLNFVKLPFQIGWNILKRFTNPFQRIFKRFGRDVEQPSSRDRH